MMARKTALVTGAGKGIGRGIAIALAENGYDVGVNYCTSVDAAMEVCKIIEEKGGRALPIKADVRNVNEIENMFSEFFSRFETIDLLVNNAGITRMRPLLEVTEEMWEEVNSTDWKGTFFCTQQAVRKMVDKGTKGVIVNITSNHQVGNWPNSNVYGPAKAAVLKFTSSVAMDYGKYGIRVVAIAPGYTDVRNLTGSPGERFISQRIVMGRFCTPEEVGKAVVYLSSEDAGYITGTCLTMDGGALLPNIVENTYVEGCHWSSRKK